MEYNFECNAFIYSKTINEKMKTAFFADLAQSTRITSSTWRRRPFVQKFKESVVRLMSPVL
jgi:cardiolipin synthase